MADDSLSSQATLPYDDLNDKRQSAVDALLTTLYEADMDCDDVVNEEHLEGIARSFRERVADNSTASVYTVNKVLEENTDAVQERWEQRARVSAFPDAWGCRPDRAIDGVSRISQPDDTGGERAATGKHTRDAQGSDKHVRSRRYRTARAHDKAMKRATLLLVGAVIAITLAIGRLVKRKRRTDE